MESKLFSDLLSSAMYGDNDALVAIISQYMPLINKQSMKDGIFDEDLRQHIIMRIIEQISKFNWPDK